jgi:hypothetical protein
MLEITKQRHIIRLFCNHIQRVLLTTVSRTHTLTFVKLTRVVNTRLASVEGAIVRRGALPGGEIDAPTSKLSETTSIEVWEASRARDVCFGEYFGVGIVK